MILNVVFPIGRKPEIKIIESKFAEKDCYVFWEKDCLDFKPSWMKDKPDACRTIISMNSLVSEIKNLKAQLVEAEGVIEFAYHNEELNTVECLKLIQIKSLKYINKYNKDNMNQTNIGDGGIE